MSLYFVWYNFARGHKALKGGTPAMTAGLINLSLSMEWLANLIDDAQRARRLQRRNSN